MAIFCYIFSFYALYFNAFFLSLYVNVLRRLQTSGSHLPCPTLFFPYSKTLPHNAFLSSEVSPIPHIYISHAPVCFLSSINQIFLILSSLISSVRQVSSVYTNITLSQCFIYSTLSYHFFVLFMLFTPNFFHLYISREGERKKLIGLCKPPLSLT